MLKLLKTPALSLARKLNQMESLLQPPQSQQPQLHSNFNLEHIFGVPTIEVDNVMDNMSHHVRKIEIPKKDGTMRRILAPDSRLKYMQKALYWRIFRRYKPNDCVHGFI